MSLDSLKREVALGSRILALTGLAAGIRSSMGHVSLRDPNDPGRFVVKGRGYPIDTLSRMRPENMVVCDLDGRLLEGPPGVVQCNEVMIHACVLKARPEEVPTRVNDLLARLKATEKELEKLKAAELQGAAGDPRQPAAQRHQCAADLAGALARRSDDDHAAGGRRHTRICPRRNGARPAIAEKRRNQRPHAFEPRQNIGRTQENAAAFRRAGGAGLAIILELF